MGIFRLFTAIATILEIITRLVQWVNDYLDKKRIERAKASVDEATRTGDQTPIEEALGSNNAGKPTRQEIPDLKTRPVRDRTQQ